MREYIEREKAFDAVFGQFCASSDVTEAALNAAIEEIRAIPAADVRPVVRCGECEFWNRERISCEGLARCNTGEGGIRYRNRDDFCSRGKKREES